MRAHERSMLGQFAVSVALSVAMSIAVSVTVLLVPPPSLGAQSRASARPRPTLPAFRSEKELAEFLRALAPPREPVGSLTKPDATCPNTAFPRSESRGWRFWRPRPATIVIAGTVRGEAGEPLFGANVLLPCDGRSVGTNVAGQYRIMLPATTRARDVRVLVRAIGYTRMLDTVRVGPGDSVTVDAVIRQDVMHLSQVVVTGANEDAAVAKVSAADMESITNTQETGVDEGGIVKVHGDHLVILRRGRLFTVRVGDDALTPVAMVDAYPEDPTRRGGWYDELLVSGDRAIVVGYSYARGATEVNLFRLDAAGDVRYESTFHLSSNDYYSWRNYASRLVDGSLYLYTPQFIYGGIDPAQAIPKMRLWRSASDTGAYRPIASPSRIHYARGLLKPGDAIALHTVTRCDLRREPVQCDARVFVGPASEVYYVSANAVYVWMTPWNRATSKSDASLVVRLPLTGESPRGVRATGSPVDQFSLDESDGSLNALVSGTSKGTWMWSSERRQAGLALVRIGLGRFGDGRDSLMESAYRPLPDVGGGSLVNRFVGGHLLYGTGDVWHRNGKPRAASHRLVVTRVREGLPTVFDLPHRVDRIEVMGHEAVVFGGSETDLHMRAVALGDSPALAHSMVLGKVAQGETRSHGFFYRATGERTGMLGLPVAREDRDPVDQLRSRSASVVFIRNEGHAFARAGGLDASGGKPPADKCVASCVDWYGNSRPIFLRGRVYALMGYELVEGRIEDGVVREVRRVDYLPSHGVSRAPSTP